MSSEILVQKSTVDVFKIGAVVYSKEEALHIWQRLSEELGKPQVEYKGCSDRYSHGAHMWKGSGASHYFCTGRSFDAT